LSVDLELRVRIKFEPFPSGRRLLQLLVPNGIACLDNNPPVELGLDTICQLAQLKREPTRGLGFYGILHLGRNRRVLRVREQ
jgi:hypothetical protein